MGFFLYQAFTPEWDIFDVYACDAPYNIPPCTNLNLTSGLGGECDTAYECYDPNSDMGDGTCMTMPATKMCDTGLVCYSGTCTDSCIPPQGADSCAGLVVALSGDGGPCETTLASCYEPNSPAGTECTLVPVMTACESGLVCSGGICYSSCIPPQGVADCNNMAVPLNPEGGSCGDIIGDCYDTNGSTAGTQCTTMPIMQDCETGLSCENGTCTNLMPSSSSFSSMSSSPC